jgi:GNAT superfamily N-acetyltransferase
MPPFTVRPARREEAELLSSLCVRSKAHWGYDAEFMRLSLSALQIDAAAIAEGRVLVAADERDVPLGVASCAVHEADVELAHLFVDPGALGRGVGAALFAASLQWARDHGHEALLIASDPNATGFYEKMGAVCIGTVPSDAIPGRSLPLLRCTLPEPTD